MTLLDGAADTRETEVRTALQSFSHCWGANDLACMDKLLAEDFDYVMPTGLTCDRAFFLRKIVKQGKPPLISSVESPPIIRFYGPVAFVTFGGPPLGEARVFDPVPTATVPLLPKLTLVWLNLDGKAWHLCRVHFYYQGVLPLIRGA